MPSSLPVGFVRVYTIDPPLTVNARLSQERPNVEQGYGGWEEVPRPRRAPLTTYKGPPALHLTLPLLLDGWTDWVGVGANRRQGRSVEPQIAALEKMGQPTAADGEPPRVHITARGSAIPYQGRRWVIDSISWGDALMDQAGNRIRQFATLALIQYVEDVHLQERSPANRRRTKAKAGKKKRGAAQKRVTTKRSNKAKRITQSREAGTTTEFGTGESLSDLAARLLGDANRWPEIAKLNGLRDPAAVKPGQVLRLP